MATEIKSNCVYEFCGHSVYAETSDRTTVIGSGYHSISANTGYCSTSINNGNNSVAVTTYSGGISINNGNECIAISSGNGGEAVVTSGNSIAIVTGWNGWAKGGVGDYLVLVERSDKDMSTILGVKVIQIDGINFKADTWYKLKNNRVIKPRRGGCIPL